MRSYPSHKPSLANSSVTLNRQEYDRTMWSCSSLKIDPIAGEMVRRIVEACGLDPEYATTAEMDNNEARLECTGCAPKRKAWGEFSSDFLVEIQHFGWREAVRTVNLHPRE